MQVIMGGDRCEAAAFSYILHDCPLKKDNSPYGMWKMALTLP